VPAFHALDGTELAYDVRGAGAPVICLPGGPMGASAYPGDLGDLFRHWQLVMLDRRGTRESAIPADPSSYRSDRLPDVVVAVMGHLGLHSADLLAHSAGANIAVPYPVQHQPRVSRLALITPSGRPVGPGTRRRNAARDRQASRERALVRGRGSRLRTGRRWSGYRG
jgi:proline iminopeptidase